MIVSPPMKPRLYVVVEELIPETVRNGMPDVARIAPAAAAIP
jgi:hypothetical protein